MARRFALLIAIILSPLMTRSASAQAPATRPAMMISRQRCDELLAQLSADPWLERKEGSVLAWNESTVLFGLLDLFAATGDRHYLDEFVRRADQELSHRDDRRDFKDYTGQTHKRWSIAGKYTVAEGVLLDAAGKPAIKLRSTASANNQVTRVQITGTANDFNLTASNKVWKRDETFANLSTDPASPRYFKTIINNPLPLPKPPAGTADKQSLLLSAEPIGDHPDAPAPQSLTLEPLWYAHVGYVGIIYHPMLEFALLARADPALKDYQPAADRFTQAAEESYAEIASYWHQGPGDNEGYYIGSKRGGAAPYDNIGSAFNYQAKHACSELALFQLTGKPQYRDHATRIAQHLKNRLEPGPNDTYVWRYWFEPVTKGWKPEDNISDHYPAHAPYKAVEDTSHATLEIAMILSTGRAEVVFDQADLRRFANTFLMNVVRADRRGFNAGVDGSNKGEAEDTAVFGWLPLAEVNPAVYTACRDVYLNRGKDDFKSLARLLKWEKLVKPPVTRPASP